MKPPSPRELLSRYGLRARKSLGQHFLFNANVALKIVDLSGVSYEKTVVELGAGLGILTWALARRVKRVLAYELDQGLLEILHQESFLPENVTLRQGDILKLDLSVLFQEVGERLVLFGNLPYYLSGRLLYRLYENYPFVEQCVFMFQKEVVDRLLASPGSKLYGLLSVLTALLTSAQRLMVLSPAQFYPQPEVSSAVVNLIFRQTELPPGFFRLLKVAFSRRRKKLLRNLQALGLDRKYLEEIFRELTIPEEVRAEALPPEKYLLLAEKLEPYEAIEKLEK